MCIRVRVNAQRLLVHIYIFFVYFIFSCVFLFVCARIVRFCFDCRWCLIKLSFSKAYWFICQACTSNTRSISICLSTFDITPFLGTHTHFFVSCHFICSVCHLVLGWFCRFLFFMQHLVRSACSGARYRHACQWQASRFSRFFFFKYMYAWEIGK